MRTDIEYLDRVESIAKDYIKGNIATADAAMGKIVAIFEELWD